MEISNALFVRPSKLAAAKVAAAAAAATVDMTVPGYSFPIDLCKLVKRVCTKYNIRELSEPYDFSNKDICSYYYKLATELMYYVQGTKNLISSYDSNSSTSTVYGAPGSGGLGTSFNNTNEGSSTSYGAPGSGGLGTEYSNTNEGSAHGFRPEYMNSGSEEYAGFGRPDNHSHKYDAPGLDSSNSKHDERGVGPCSKCGENGTQGGFHAKCGGTFGFNNKAKCPGCNLQGVYHARCGRQADGQKNPCRDKNGTALRNTLSPFVIDAAVVDAKKDTQLRNREIRASLPQCYCTCVPPLKNVAGKRHDKPRGQGVCGKDHTRDSKGNVISMKCHRQCGCSGPIGVACQKKGCDGINSLQK
jgi:hypothetical protein